MDVLSSVAATPQQPVAGPAGAVPTAPAAAPEQEADAGGVGVEAPAVQEPAPETGLGRGLDVAT